MMPGRPNAQDRQNPEFVAVRLNPDKPTTPKSNK
jgi:hypothetical protein